MSTTGGGFAAGADTGGVAAATGAAATGAVVCVVTRLVTVRAATGAGLAGAVRAARLAVVRVVVLVVEVSVALVVGASGSGVATGSTAVGGGVGVVVAGWAAMVPASCASVGVEESARTAAIAAAPARACSWALVIMPKQHFGGNEAPRLSPICAIASTRRSGLGKLGGSALFLRILETA